MFEKLDRFIKDNSEEILITGGWGEDKISELEQKLNVSFREELKIFIRRYLSPPAKACCRYSVSSQGS